MTTSKSAYRRRPEELLAVISFPDHVNPAAFSMRYDCPGRSGRLVITCTAADKGDNTSSRGPEQGIIIRRFLARNAN
jgi:hypothetical protein